MFMLRYVYAQAVLNRVQDDRSTDHNNNNNAEYTKNTSFEFVRFCRISTSRDNLKSLLLFYVSTGLCSDDGYVIYALIVLIGDIDIMDDCLWYIIFLTTLIALVNRKKYYNWLFTKKTSSFTKIFYKKAIKTYGIQL